MSLELFIACFLLLSLILYALLAGADFGGGMWDLLAFGPRKKEQRKMIESAIGPIWEANHVWMILVIVILFSAFPSTFSVLMTALHVPITLVLIGIVLRGSTFIFRKYDSQNDQIHQRWSFVFGISSFLTPLFLGIILGATATGGLAIKDGYSFLDLFQTWLAPFPIACGFFAQGLFAFLAAVYLTVDTEGSKELQEDFRLRGLLSGVSLAPVAFAVFFLSKDGAPYIYQGLTSSWSPFLLILTSYFAIGSLFCLWKRKYFLGRVHAIGQVISILLGWGAAQYPYFIVGGNSLYQLEAPLITLKLLTWGLIISVIVLLPSFFYLFSIFKKRSAKDSVFYK